MVRKLALALALSVVLGCRSTNQASEPIPPVPTPRSAHDAGAPPAAHAAAAAQVMRVHFINVSTRDCIWVHTGDDGIPGISRLESSGTDLVGCDSARFVRMDGTEAAI